MTRAIIAALTFWVGMNSSWSQGDPNGSMMVCDTPESMMCYVVTWAEYQAGVVHPATYMGD